MIYIVTLSWCCYSMSCRLTLHVAQRTSIARFNLNSIRITQYTRHLIVRTNSEEPENNIWLCRTNPEEPENNIWLFAQTLKNRKITSDCSHKPWRTKSSGTRRSVKCTNAPTLWSSFLTPSSECTEHYHKYGSSKVLQDGIRINNSHGVISHNTHDRMCYKSEGRWLDPSWCHWNISLT